MNNQNKANKEKFGWYQVNCLVQTILQHAELQSVEVIAHGAIEALEQSQLFFRNLSRLKAKQILPKHIFRLWDKDRSCIWGANAKFLREATKEELTGDNQRYISLGKRTRIF